MGPSLWISTGMPWKRSSGTERHAKHFQNFSRMACSHLQILHLHLVVPGRGARACARHSAALIANSAETSIAGTDATCMALACTWPTKHRKVIDMCVSLLLRPFLFKKRCGRLFC